MEPVFELASYYEAYKTECEKNGKQAKPYTKWLFATIAGTL